MENNDKLEQVISEAENQEEDKSQAAALVNLVLQSKAELFHDQFNTGFIAVEGDGTKILKLRSRDFKNWLSHLGWYELGKAIPSSSIETAVRTLEGRAAHEKEEIELHVRVANYNKGLCYDLGDGNAVEVNKKGWKILKPAPKLFYSFSHQRPQVMPIKGGDIKTIYEFIPSPKDPRQKLLLLVWLVAAVLPGFPHPILVIHGPQGSRKTTLSKLLRNLIDPSVMGTLTTNGDIREYVQLASHHYFLPFDNLSPIKPDFSDILCRTVTGEGMSKRELYSDDDDIIYSFRRIVAMNGINLVVNKPDLLERSLIIELERPFPYQEEATLLSKFEQERPRLLGAIFHTIQKAMHVFETATMPADIGKFRMADFVRWGCAISHILGHTTEDFMEALAYNLEQQNAEAIDESPIAQVVISFMQKHEECQDTPTNLLSQFKMEAVRLTIDIKQKEFPRSASWLWRRLRMVSTNLLALGIKVDRSKEGARLITLSRVGKNADNGVSGVSDGKTNEKNKK